MESCKAAFSYFRESFSEYDMINSPNAVKALKYMMLTHLLQDLPKEVVALTKGDLAVKYSGRETDSMKALAVAKLKRSLAQFEQALVNFHKEINEDSIIKRCVDKLFNNMVEDSIHAAVLPYSVVQLAYIAEKIHLPCDEVEKKLSTMILDKKLAGSLDNKNGEMVFIGREEEEAMESDLEITSILGHIVNKLEHKAYNIF